MFIPRSGAAIITGTPENQAKSLTRSRPEPRMRTCVFGLILCLSSVGLAPFLAHPSQGFSTPAGDVFFSREGMGAMQSDIRIYVADLAAYNNGILHGVWIDATDDLNSIWEQIQAMLKQSPVEDAEEHAIHDYEGFGPYQVSEYEGIAELHAIAEFIEEYGAVAAELLDYYNDLDEAKKAMEEQYNGCYSSLADYAQELTEDTQEIPQHLEFYIDYERMGRDMELSGDVFTIETVYQEVHVFWSH